MKRSIYGGLLGLGLTSIALPAAADNFNFTIVAGHPPLTGGVRMISEVFIPETTSRLEALGHTVSWIEGYAGSIADVSGVLEAVESGIAEFGYVPHLFEGDKLPLEQITYVTPFGTDDLGKLMQVIDELHAAVPALDAAWAEQNQKVLAPVGIDTYQFVSNFPIDKLSDLDGKKIGTAGLALNWLKGTGSTPISGSLPDFYNAMSTGLYDGVMTFESAIAPYKFFEVAPIITEIGFGGQYASALTVNLDVWEGLPDDVRAAVEEAADIYRVATAETYQTSGATSIETALAGGAEVVSLNPGVREAYAAALPDIAGEWASSLDARGLPGTETLQTYMRLSREAGIQHVRDWAPE